MASIRKHGKRWQVQVRRQGLRPLTRTFHLKADAELWARQREAEVDRFDLPVDHRALRSLKACEESYKLPVLLAHPTAGLSLERLSPSEVAA